MKKIIALTTAAFLAGSISAYAADATDATAQMEAAASTQSTTSSVDLDKVSYIIGYEMGKGFKSQNIDLNVSQLQKGVNTALAGKDSAISQSDSKKIMQAFQQQMIQKAQAKLKADSAANSKTSEAFMSAIAKMKGIEKAADGIYYQMLKKGDGQIPAKTDTVTVDYTGTTPAKAFTEDSDAATSIEKACY